MASIDRKYRIELDGRVIGFTLLENSDAPMGVVFGLIHFENIVSGFSLFLDYCLNNGVTINENDIKYRFIDTQTIPALKVFSDTGIEIKGIGTSITGMDSEWFEIHIFGIPHSFYKEEFSHYLKQV